MAGRILKDDIDALRERADIVAVVGDHTKLQRAGGRMKGLCPFHQEKTPSFTVDPAKNLYHCFGCGVGGDLYDFLMRIEGLDFTEAVEQLARRTGFTLRYEEMSARERRALGERSRLVSVTAAAHAIFRETLFSDAGVAARDYLKARGFGKEEADAFELGFATNDWDALSRRMVAEGVAREELIKVGLAVKNDRGGLRDRFRGRLIFPVHDLAGDVIGFGGRVLPGIDYGDFDPPKYYNSPETPLYKKTRVLYGLLQARPEIVRAEEVLVCEGYTDVMALHQAGFANAVATCGTAVGQEHFRILSRYAQRVVLAFDADAAGFKAAERAWEEARKVEGQHPEGSAPGERHTFDLRVLVLPPGQDPADLVREAGVAALRAAVEGARGVVPFLIEHTIADGDLGSEEGKAATLRAAVRILADEPDPELRRAYARSEIADRIGYSVEFVEKTAERLGIQLDRHQGVATLTPQRSGARGHVARLDRQRASQERAVLRLALQAPQLLPEDWYEITVDDFSHPKARAVFTVLVEAGGAGVETARVLDAAPDDEIRTLLRELSLEDGDVPLDAESAAWIVRQLLVARVDAERTELTASLERVNPVTDRDDWLALNGRLAELEHRRRELSRTE